MAWEAVPCLIKVSRVGHHLGCERGERRQRSERRAVNLRQREPVVFERSSRAGDAGDKGPVLSGAVSGQGFSRQAFITAWARRVADPVAVRDSHIACHDCIGKGNGARPPQPALGARAATGAGFMPSRLFDRRRGADRARCLRGIILSAGF